MWNYPGEPLDGTVEGLVLGTIVLDGDEDWAFSDEVVSPDGYVVIDGDGDYAIVTSPADVMFRVGRLDGDMVIF